MNNELNFENNKPQVSFENTTENIQFQAPQNVVGGTSDYEKLKNKPQINNVELDGNKTIQELGITAEIIAITGELKNLKKTNKTNLVNAINEIKEINDDAYAYNFTVVAESFVYNPKEAQALAYMAHNWQTKAMSLFVKGYPVVALDINNRHMKVLYKDRYIQTFTWEVDGLLTRCYIKPVSIKELVFKEEVEKYVNGEISKLKKYIDEALANNQN